MKTELGRIGYDDFDGGESRREMLDKYDESIVRDETVIRSSAEVKKSRVLKNIREKLG